MKLTSDLLTPYIGGQVLIENELDGYTYRGKIQSISLERDTLHITYAWFASGEEGSIWFKDEKTSDTWRVEFAEAIEIGWGNLRLSTPYWRTSVSFHTACDPDNITEGDFYEESPE